MNNEMHKNHIADLHLPAKDYVEHCKNLAASDISPIELQEKMRTLKQHDFATYLNRAPNFIKAKQKLISKNVIILEINAPDSNYDYLQQIVLEYICANIFGVLLPSKNLEYDIVATKKQQKEIQFSMKRLQSILRKYGGIYFASSAKQHLLQFLLDDLINDNTGNVFSDKKQESHYQRRLMFKRLIEGMCRSLPRTKDSIHLFTEVALDICNIFYGPMDKEDAKELAERIQPLVEQENIFLTKTVAELLGIPLPHLIQTQNN